MTLHEMRAVLLDAAAAIKKNQADFSTYLNVREVAEELSKLLGRKEPPLSEDEVAAIGTILKETKGAHPGSGLGLLRAAALERIRRSS